MTTTRNAAHSNSDSVWSDGLWPPTPAYRQWHRSPSVLRITFTKEMNCTFRRNQKRPIERSKVQVAAALETNPDARRTINRFIAVLFNFLHTMFSDASGTHPLRKKTRCSLKGSCSTTTNKLIRRVNNLPFIKH